MGSHDRGGLPEELQSRLKSIFRQPTYNADDIPDCLRIGDGVVSSLQVPIYLKSPFRLAQEREPLEIDVYSMSIVDEGGTYSVNFRAGVSSAKLFEAASEDLDSVCALLIDKLASAKSGEIDDSDKAALRAYLESNGADVELVDDDDFLEELGIQVNFMAESIGISVIAFADDSGEEVEFWIEGDEEIGLLETPHDFKQSAMDHKSSESNTTHAGSTDQVELYVGGNECLLIPQKYLKSIGLQVSEIVYAQNQEGVIYLTSRAIGSDSICTRILKSGNISLSQDHFRTLGFKVHPGSSFFLAEIDQGLSLTRSD